MRVLKASGVESRVVMSLKMMPGFGKSGMSRILSRMIFLSWELSVFMMNLCRSGCPLPDINLNKIKAYFSY